MLKDMNFEELLVMAVESNPDALLELSDRYHKGTGGVPSVTRSRLIHMRCRLALPEISRR